MKKLFLAVSSMIVTGFLIKSYRKLRDRPDTEEEVYRLMKAAHKNHREIERRCADARATFNRMDANRMDAISTPMDGGLLSSIDAVQQMAPGRFA